ncbi:ParA family protein [Gelria sp. Kuro-4]|uniref:ParA family protein n=1 Tax=Gelria sp. Kuro-4 TaxID=2796927 RepID=UPI001BEFD25D|nr:ParA family protein [Gelria sp. Kuro-4]BCV26000.1 phage-related regulatory protein [Gelria sp. Kuro-4]
MQVITIFNHKGGVGKTTVAFNLGLALGKLGKRVLLADLDPQANLTALAIPENDLFSIYGEDAGWTIAMAVRPLISGEGDFVASAPQEIRHNVLLVPGDIRLADFESLLPSSWTESLAGQERGFRVTSAIYRLLHTLSRQHGCDLVICDVGPNIGALNRAIIASSDFLMLPVSSDLFSLRALETVGKSVVEWVKQWRRARGGVPQKLGFDIPRGSPVFLGYVVQQFGVYGGRPAAAYRHWQERLEPALISGVVTPLQEMGLVRDSLDSLKLANIRDFHSLAPKAQQTCKAIFELDSSEAPGQHINTVAEASQVFEDLATKVIVKTSEN